MSWVNPVAANNGDPLTLVRWNQDAVDNPQFLYDNLGVWDAKAGYTELGAPANFTFPNISQAYDTLILVASLRSVLSGGGNNDNVRIRFNNDAGNNYGYSYLTQVSTTVAGVGNTGLSYIPFLYAPTADATALVYASLFMVIPWYSEAVNHKTVTLHGHTGSNLTNFKGGATWMNPTPQAITRIDISPLVGANFAAGSKAALFGAQSI
ncbi:MAG: hypothetical protein KIT08_01270 [Anaerolineales bacterium]|nr:MAG: hypothetical protein KIT08_01270 [Anaerolineales bacterium]